MGLIQHLKDRIKGTVPAGARRSSKWSGVRKAHLSRFPNCAVCCGTEKTEVHHVQPFHMKPELELDPSNLITLCESKKNGINCHLLQGHLGDFKCVNSAVRSDTAIWNHKIGTRGSTKST